MEYKACQLLANSVRLFELGYFDCAFYSIRQSMELSLSGLYLFSNPDKIKGWKNLTKDFETILHDTITAVALYRLVIEPFPILMLDEDIVSRMPDLIAEPFSRGCAIGDDSLRYDF